MRQPNLSRVERQQGPFAKAPSHRNRILALLRSRGTIGVTNVELNAICFRYGARIFELRRQGFTIQTQAESDGVYRFLLVREPGVVAQVLGETLPLFAGATESLRREV